MSAYFITGTDTEVGKTFATCALLEAVAATGRRAVGMKPVASGCWVDEHGVRQNEDVLAHAAAGNVAAPRALANPYAFLPPISPHLAAAEEGVAIDLDLLLDRYRQLSRMADFTLVEGAGGWLAPIDPGTTMADLARTLDLPVILVVGMRLGCLNHAMLTAESIAARGARLAGWIANCVDPAMARPEQNLSYLQDNITAPLLGVIPYSPNAKKAQANQVQILGFQPQNLLE